MGAPNSRGRTENVERALWTFVFSLMHRSYEKQTFQLNEVKTDLRNEN